MQTATASVDSSAPRLAMEGVRKSFGATVALAGVDFQVRAGEVHALVGENGAGKSTLMKVLSGVYRPDAGRMRLDGALYSPACPADGRQAGIAMIYQELSLAPHLSIAENIMLGVEPVSGPFVRRRELLRRAGDALAEIGHRDMPVDMPVSRLAVAQRQLVEIARAVATGCRVLVLDEPTSCLSGPDMSRLFDLIKRLRLGGIAVIYISHFLEEIMSVAETFTVLRDGRTVGAGETRNVSRREIVSMMVGREVNNLYPRSRAVRGEPVLEVRDLAGRDKPVSASLVLHRGEVLGIGGLVGAGRTELFRAIFALDVVVRGEVRVGLHAGPGTPARRWSQGVGFLSEDRKREGLALSLSVADNITLPRLKGLGPAFLVTRSAQYRAARRWIDALPIKCLSPSRPVNDLSGGNQQKVALARLLHADVDVLLLDEPTRGIDVGSKAQIYALIDRLARGEAKPRAVLMISSYLPELLGVCDRVAVMCRGVLGPARPVEELDEHAVMLEATGV